MVASSFIILISGRLWRFPTSKSFGSCAGVIFNWCPVCKTSISDAEVNYEEQSGHFWHIKYPVVGTEEFFFQMLDNLNLGRNARMIRPWLPKGVVALHPLKTRQDILHRIVSLANWLFEWGRYKIQ